MSATCELRLERRAARLRDHRRARDRRRRANRRRRRERCARKPGAAAEIERAVERALGRPIAPRRRRHRVAQKLRARDSRALLAAQRSKCGAYWSNSGAHIAGRHRRRPRRAKPRQLQRRRRGGPRGSAARASRESRDRAPAVAAALLAHLAEREPGRGEIRRELQPPARRRSAAAARSPRFSKSWA